MTGDSFRGKPSKTHIIWQRETRTGTAQTQFDSEHFRKWVSHCGFEFESATRTDHERADEPREQFRAIFHWTTTAGETLEMDGDTWELGNQKTPRTFVEIDKHGHVRAKGWEFEAVFEAVELYHDGHELIFETKSGETKRIHCKHLVENGVEDDGGQ